MVVTAESLTSMMEHRAHGMDCYQFVTLTWLRQLAIATKDLQDMVIWRAGIGSFSFLLENRLIIALLLSFYKPHYWKIVFFLFVCGSSLTCHVVVIMWSHIQDRHIEYITSTTPRILLWLLRPRLWPKGTICHVSFRMHIQHAIVLRRTDKWTCSRGYCTVRVL